MKRALFAAALFAAIAGCKSAERHVPDREIVRTIPAERARVDLERLLENAGITEYRVKVDQFAYEANGWSKFHYAELDPHAYRWKVLETTYFIVRPKGEYGGSTPELEGDLIWFHAAHREDAEKLLDTLESLKAAAVASAKP